MSKGRLSCLRIRRSGMLPRTKSSLKMLYGPRDITSRAWSPASRRFCSLFQLASVSRLRPTLGTDASATYRSMKTLSGCASAAGSSPAPALPVNSCSTSRWLRRKWPIMPAASNSATVFCSNRSLRTRAIWSGSALCPKPSFLRATFNAADSTLWLMMRTDAVALETPSRYAWPAEAWPASGLRVRFALLSIFTFCFSDKPWYCLTKASSGASPRPSRNTGSWCDNTATSRNDPCGSIATSRLTGTPEKPGMGARSTDSKT